MYVECSMVAGYQKGNSDGLAAMFHSTRLINGPYVDGISGIQRKQVCIYTIGLSY